MRLVLQQPGPVPLVGQVDQVQVHGQGAGQLDGLPRIGRFFDPAALLQPGNLFSDPVQPRLSQYLLVNAGQHR